MSNLGPQQQSVSYDGVLQIPGGVTAQLQQVQDGDGRATGLWLSSVGANLTTADSFTASVKGFSISGAIPRLISDGFGDWINVADFGVIGDGTTDNTNALFSLQDFLTNNPGRTIVFSPGVYLYSNPYWLRGVQNVTIYGYGASFQNVLKGSAYGGSDFNQDQACLTVNDLPFVKHGRTQLITNSPTSTNPFYGYKINSATNGETTITLTSSGDASHFSVGNRIIIGGYSQYRHGSSGSYPPDYRYWEVQTITNISGGVITLGSELRNSYDSNWGDDATGVGAPRVLSLDVDQPNYYYNYIENIRFYGVKFLPNPFSIYTPYGLYFAGINNLTMVDCDTDGTYFTQDFIQQMFYERGKIGFPNELGDKLCGTLEFKNTNIEGFTNFVGTSLAIFDGCTITNNLTSVCQLAPDNVVFKNCHFYNTIGASTNDFLYFAGYQNSTYSAIFKNNIFRNASRTIIGGATEYSFTIASVVDYQTITVSGEPDNLINLLKRGYVIYTKNQGSGSINTIIGKVFNIIPSSASTTITASFNQLPSVGNVFYWSTMQIFDVDQSNTFIDGPLQYQVSLNQTDDKAPQADVLIKRAQVNFSDINLTRYLYVNGTPIRIILNVIKPYTGDTGITGYNGIAYLKLFYFQNGAATTQLCSIRADTVGMRIIDLTQSFNAQTGDTLPSGGHMGNSITELQLLLVNAFSGQIVEHSLSPLTQPQITAIIEYTPFTMPN